MDRTWSLWGEGGIVKWENQGDSCTDAGRRCCGHLFPYLKPRHIFKRAAISKKNGQAQSVL
jgi:hypothetical protein